MGTYKITEEDQQKMFDTFREILAKYKFDWNTLRAIMTDTRAVISGSTALAVLLGGEFVPQELDIYVNAKGFIAILGFLMDHGYQVVMPQPHYAHRKDYHPTNILTLKRDGVEEKIDLIRTEVHVLTAITEFHSTAVMNYIAFYGIVCLYPEWTMQRSRLVTGRNVPYEILDKYRRRGFNIAHTLGELAKHNINHNCQCSGHVCCPSLVIPFDGAM